MWESLFGYIFKFIFTFVKEIIYVITGNCNLQLLDFYKDSYFPKVICVVSFILMNDFLFCIKKTK